MGAPCLIYEDGAEPVSSYIEGIDFVQGAVISERVNYHPSNIKPILRQFSSLSREEVEHLEKLWTRQETTEDSILSSANVVEYLTSIHVDVFKWIEKGLAVDAALSATIV